MLVPSLRNGSRLTSMTSGAGDTCSTLTSSARPDTASSTRPLRYSSGSTSAGSGGRTWPSSKISRARFQVASPACTAATALRMIRARSAAPGSTRGECSAA